MITETQRKNFETLSSAFASGNVALIEVEHAASGEVRTVIAAIGYDGSEYLITPFAEMVRGNPFEVYNPPNPDGGFHRDTNVKADGFPDGMIV